MKPGQAAAAKSGPPPRPAARPDARKALTVGKMQSEDRRGRRGTIALGRDMGVRRPTITSPTDDAGGARGARSGAGGRGKRGVVKE